MNTLVIIYLLNVLFSIGIITSTFLFYTQDYSELKQTTFYYFYWIISLLSFTFGFLEVFFHIIVQRIFIGFTSIFFSLSWIASTILSSLIVNECVSKYNNCSTIISLTTFACLQTIIWCISVYLIWFVYRQTDNTSNSSNDSNGSNGSISVTQQVHGQVHRQVVICSPVSVISQRPEIVDLEMDDIKL